MTTLETMARELALLHGGHIISSSGGESVTVASQRMGAPPTGFPDIIAKYAERHWREYMHVAEAISTTARAEAIEAAATLSESMSEYGVSGRQIASAIRGIK